MKLARKIMKVTGKDRVKFLNDLLTIEITSDMHIRYGALLSAQGKIQSDLFVWAEEDALNIDLPESQYSSIKAKLSMYKLRADVELTDMDIEAHQTKEGFVDPRNPNLGCRFYGAFAGKDISEDAFLALRVDNLVPEFDIDFSTNEAYPIEWRFSQMGGIDYKKGCYIGQEIAARMRHKTVLQKSILAVQIEGDPKEETQVMAGGKVIGKLLSISEDKAMIFAKLSAVQPIMNVGDARLPLND